jgi:DNA-binding transcriptional LysR family regulator
VVARVGSFSAAARELAVAPSVVTKRITRLEERMRTRLIVRSTRGLALTAAGERFLPRFMRVVAELEELFIGCTSDPEDIQGHVRIQGPTTVTSMYLGALFSEFQAGNPRVSIDIRLLDRSVNPLEEGIDLVIGAQQTCYPNVVDVPLCHYPLVCCCAPGYLRGRNAPSHPQELVDHECLTSMLLGNTWQFENATSPVSVDVQSRFHANDARLVLEAVHRSLGIAILPRYLIEEELGTGAIVALLEEFPVARFWLKAMVPRMKMEKPVVRELVSFLKAHMHPLAPWETAGSPDSSWGQDEAALAARVSSALLPELPGHRVRVVERDD